MNFDLLSILTDYILFLLSKWFQKRRFLWEFPIGSYVKLSSAMVAILVGGLKCRSKSSPQKPLGQLQPNFGGMVLGWPPSKIVSTQDGRQAKNRKKGPGELKT
jgi:hypothetical protein